MRGPRAPKGEVGARARALARLAFRKLIYRRTTLGVWAARAGDVRCPAVDDGVVLELLGPDRFGEVVGTTPHLTEADLAAFGSQRTTCIVARDGDAIVASTWMTSGEVLVHELHRTVDVPAHEHFSCRSYVAESHRGHHLLARMIATYAATLDADDEVWGLVYEWNEASIRSLERIGWRRCGTEWTVFLADRPIAGRRRFPPRPALPRLGGRPALPPCILVGAPSWGSTLQAARSLSRTGVPVLVVTVGVGAPVFRHSRHVAAAVDLPDASPERLSAVIDDLVAAHAPGVDRLPVLPLTDEAVDLLDQARDRLPAPVVLALPDAARTRPLLTKPSALALAEEAGLHVLPWRAVEGTEDLPAVAELRLPVIVRPTAWNTTGEPYFKLAVARTAPERDRLIESALHRGAQVVVQEYLEVPEDAVELALTWRSSDGSATAIVTGRKRRAATAAGGVMAWGEAVELPEVADAARAFLDHTGFVGIGGIELIRHDGRLWFVEFNPRVESIHFLAASAGSDTVVLAYQDLALDQRPARPARPYEAAAWIGSAWMDRIRHDRSSWRLALADRRAFGRHRHGRRAVWDPTDPGPSLALLALLGRRGLTHLPGGAR